MNRMDLSMDIAAAHIDCPLKLKKLLESNKSDFYHDIGGIVDHMNRVTNKLENCFVPRFAVWQ